MRPILLLAALLTIFSPVWAGGIAGTVKDEKGNLLAYASILVKGTGIGTTSNDAGRYSLHLEPGKYTIVCQYVGYARAEKSVTISNADETLDFTLSVLQTTMKEFVVRPGGEDPAYEIIRNAIRKRPYYLNQLDRFQCEVYIKGQLNLRSFPKKLFGQKVDFEDGDSSQRKMLYLAETVSTYSVEKPNKVRIDVASSKVSGQSDGFGLSQPQILSFYQNNIQIGKNLNPRGFVSPIAENAFNFYSYKFAGSFFEDGKEINKIQVIPKKKYEPVFSGYINITENDWRIHSVHLQLTKASQMEFIDTLQIEQLYVPLNNDVWVIKNQVLYPSVQLMGFDATGSFVNVYSEFDLHPVFPKNFFTNTFLRYLDSSNKRTAQYWDSVRPVPLKVEEIVDYRKKDSLEQIRKSPAYIDSTEKKRNKLSAIPLLFTGQTFTRSSRRSTYSVSPLVNALNYNTVEGLVATVQATYQKRLDTLRFNRRSFSLSPSIRYGFNNRHFNPSLSGNYIFGKRLTHMLTAGAGKDVFQFNNTSTYTERTNTINTLIFEKNFLKIYEAWFARVNYRQGITEGLDFNLGMSYQDRLPLENTTGYTFRDVKKRVFTPNFPTELISTNIRRHQAVVAVAGLTWQPGARYIEFPERKYNLGSDYPTFDLTYIKGIERLLGSDVNYDKWQFVMFDDVNLRLAGTVNYRLSFGGFVNTHKLQVIDYQHFNGNQSIFASRYLNSFQLAPFYLNSTTTSFYSTVNLEHHLNGLLTNKVPLLKKLNWNLVVGTNAFYVNSTNNYVEAFAGLENIFKLFRVDFIQSFSANHQPFSGITIGMQGALFGRRNR